MLLKWALIFFVISLVAAVFAFIGIISLAAAIAKVLFCLFLTASVALLIAGLLVRHELFS